MSKAAIPEETFEQVPIPSPKQARGSVVAKGTRRKIKNSPTSPAQTQIIPCGDGMTHRFWHVSSTGGEYGPFMSHRGTELTQKDADAYMAGEISQHIPASVWVAHREALAEEE